MELSAALSALLLLGQAEQAVGFYSEGRLVNPASFEAEGPGYLKLFRARDRGWAADEMSELLQIAAEEMAERYPSLERLQIGDVAGRRGGRISGHASHQNGLDADIVYFRRDAREQDPDFLGGFDEEFVIKGEVTANFDVERNWELVSLLVGSGLVNRIFMDPAIKQELCEHASSLPDLSGSEAEEILRRLRPYPNHGDHMHVRIVCPASSPRCRAQDEPPPGHGCAGADLVDARELIDGLAP